MPTIDIYNAGGDVVGSMDLNENVYQEICLSGNVKCKE